MKYTYYLMDEQGNSLGNGTTTANDEGDCIEQVATKYRYTSLGDGWYQTISGRKIEIQVK